MQQTVQIWFTESGNVKGIWFKALSLFILVMALVWLSLTSGSVKWALPLRNEGMFNLRVLVHLEL